MPLRTGQEFASPDASTIVRVVEASPERGVFERRHAPGTGRTNAHFHGDFRQRFEVIAGSIEVVVDGTGHSIEAGAAVDVRPGVGHVDPYNTAGQPATCRTIVEPLTPFVETYFASYGAWLGAGALDGQQEFTILELMAVMSAGRGETFAVGPPVVLQRLAFPVLGLLALANGIRATS